MKRLAASALMLASALAASAVPVSAVLASAAQAAATGPTVTLRAPGNFLGAEELPETVSYQLHGTDSASETLTYSATGLPQGVTLDPATGLVSGAVSRYYDGEVSVTATDTSGASASVSFTWRAENQISLDIPSVEQAPPGTTVTLDPHGTSSNPADPLTYSASQLPSGLSIDPATGIITGTAPATVGSYDVTVTASDVTGSWYSTIFEWHIWNTITVAVPAEPSSVAGQPITPIQATATEAVPDQQLTFGLRQTPAGLSIDPVTGIISGTPSAWALGSYETAVTATDSSGSAGSAVIGWVVRGKITVSNPGNTKTGVGQPAFMTIKVTDTANGDQLTYSMSGAPPGVSLNSRTGLIQGWPTTPGTYHTTIAAHGKYGSAAAAKFAWTVTPASGSGLTGPVKLRQPGKCLDDAGNKSAAGTKVQLRACDGAASQRWTYAADDTLRIHGQCLSVKGTAKRGAGLVLGHCSNSAGKRWPIAGRAMLINEAAKLCLAAPVTSTKNTMPVVLDKCLNQSWTLPFGHLRSPVPGKCAAVSASGDRIVLQACNSSKAQQWTIGHGGAIRVVTGKCLGVFSYLTGYGAVLMPCNREADQWSVVPDHVVLFLKWIPAERKGACLSVPEASTANGTQLQTAKCTSNITDWHFG